MSTCTTTKSIHISFTPPTIAPANGYLVKYRSVGDLVWSSVNGVGSPIIIPSVLACANIEGTVQANCGGGNTGMIASFLIPGIGFPLPTASWSNYACSSGNASIKLNGNPGSTMRVSLVASGNVTFASGGSGTCSWLDATMTTSTTQSISGTSSSSTTTTELLDIGTGDTLYLDVVIPASGYIIFNIQLNLNNASSITGASTALKVISIDNTTIIPIIQPVCINHITTVGCGV